jgi:protein-tyrosine phosphatase
VSAKLLLWADVIYVMEHKHKKILLERFRNEIQGKQLEVLDIPDDYQYMDEELVDMLEMMVSI